MVPGGKDVPATTPKERPRQRTPLPGDPAISTALQRLAPLHQRAPLDAVEVYASLLEVPPLAGRRDVPALSAAALKVAGGKLVPRDRVRVLESYASALSASKRWMDAAAAQREALRVRMTTMMAAQRKSNRGSDAAAATAVEADGDGFSSPADVIAAMGALATALQDAGAYDEALAVVESAQSQVAALGGLKDGRTRATLSPALRRVMVVMLKMESGVHACKGDAVTALARWENARAMAKALGEGGGEAEDDPAGTSAALNHIDLLSRVLANDPPPPPRVAEGLSAELGAQVAALLARGPWVHPQQLPKTFVPGLASRPWHSVPDHFPALAPVQAVLVAATAELREEVDALMSRHLLLREHECIHASGEDTGAWHHYSVNGFWLRLDSDGCSVDTPAACGVLARIRALGVPGLTMLRAGYSVVDARAHLHPHFGVTNAQLKFHLGLIVPAGEDGAPCATLRVGNETRAWSEGGVLFFDDSWEHEVWSTCSSPRAVFQFVFGHPDLQPGALAALGMPVTH